MFPVPIYVTLAPEHHFATMNQLRSSERDKQPVGAQEAMKRTQFIDLTCDNVYFLGASSPTSFSGHLNPGLDDSQIQEFIFRNNSTLYARLWQPWLANASHRCEALDQGAPPSPPPISTLSYLDASSDSVSTPNDELIISAATSSDPKSDTTFSSTSSSCPGIEGRSSVSLEGLSSCEVTFFRLLGPDTPRIGETEEKVPLSPGQGQLKTGLCLLQSKRSLQSFLGSR